MRKQLEDQRKRSKAQRERYAKQSKEMTVDRGLSTWQFWVRADDVGEFGKSLMVSD
jgi:hypothetical protein